jgi:hypothetical protein
VHAYVCTCACKIGMAVEIEMDLDLRSCKSATASSLRTPDGIVLALTILLVPLKTKDEKMGG